jgi:hypothetical protein
MDEYALAYANKQADHIRDLMNANKSKDDAIAALYRDLELCGQRAEAAEARAAQLQAERDDARRRNEILIANNPDIVFAMLRSERDEMARKLEQARAELHFFHSAFPQATRQYKALNDWESETPFGQALDGMGDEVET